MRGLLGAIADAARVAVNALPPRLLCRLAFPDLNQGDALLRVAEGSGPGGWRGPWGHSQAECRDGYAYGYNGCPPGSWRGPWGHCRNTPFHGRHPNGLYY